MSENLIADVKAGYDANQSMVDDRQSRQSLKDAYAQTESTTGENGVAAKDMFKVNSLAAQMAAQSGNLKAAEKFDKQAQDSKSNEIQNQLSELKMKQTKFAEAEKHIQMMNSPKDVIDILNSEKDIDPVLKMKLSAQVLQLGDDPAAFKEWKDNLNNGMLDANQKTTAARKLLEDQWNHEIKMGMLNERLSRDRQTATLQGMMYGLQADRLDEQKTNHFNETRKDYNFKIADVDKEINTISAKLKTSKNGEGDKGLQEDLTRAQLAKRNLTKERDSLVDPRNPRGSKGSKDDSSDHNDGELSPEQTQAAIKQTLGADYKPDQYDYSVVKGRVIGTPKKKK
jgi:hypothetical protein